ncbi:MAG TPA: FAD-dependent oxidoreductase [Nocardioidaceae bacterium]|nr:FAD-dependent oxidoreductase [Nocardioidaceae bacterium]
MNRIETIVVVGGGLAAGRAVQELREQGFEGRIVLFASERHRPYERPPLSKGYLMRAEPLEKGFVHPADWYDAHGVDLRLGTPVTGLRPDQHLVAAAGEDLAYDRLLLATGASPRRLALADESGAPVAYLRTIEDSQHLRQRLAPGLRVVIVGGGWIGLEVASAARTAGCEVTVVETLTKPLLRVLGSEVADVFLRLHEEHGVVFRLGASISGVESRGTTSVVHLEDGTDLEADLLVAGVGVSPNADLATAAGLDSDNGILVDEHLRTSNPDVFAAGDVANAHHPLLGRRVRVEHWDNAIQQGRAAARSMLGDPEPYARLPYFFTDQYDLGMEYVGHVGPEGYDDVVLRGDVAGRVFTAFWLSGGKVIAGMHANDWDAIDPVRRVVSAGSVDLGALRDSSVPLADLA